MIKQETYSKSHLENIKSNYPRVDIQLIEKTVFAFGLLELLSLSNLPFIFKGGTSLLLVLSNPYCLSTDIDILIEPDLLIEKYLPIDGTSHPFIRIEEDFRTKRNSMLKRHFRFVYLSPMTNRENSILLDVLYEHHGYRTLKKVLIQSAFLSLDDTNPAFVVIPSTGSLLGDKLTAFAPNTIGIPFQYESKSGLLINKTLEVAKQFIDIYALLMQEIDFLDVIESYLKIANDEIRYRGLSITAKDGLLDTFSSTLAIISKGKYLPDQYRLLIEGFDKLQNHVLGISVNGEAAVLYSASIMLLIAKIFTNETTLSCPNQSPIIDQKYRFINKLRKRDQEAFNLAAISLRLIYEIN